MADPNHLAKLHQGPDAWNDWREENPSIRPDLAGVDLTSILQGGDAYRKAFSNVELHQAVVAPPSLPDLRNVNLMQATLSNANLKELDFEDANLSAANLTGADLRRARFRRSILHGARLANVNAQHTLFYRAHLSAADLSGADFSHASVDAAELGGARLCETNFEDAYLGHSRLTGVMAEGAIFRNAGLPYADLSHANLQRSILCGASLEGARIVKTNLREANLSGARVYGVSAWDVELGGALQTGLVLNEDYLDFEVTVDGLEAAQFVYLLLNNRRVRQMIDSVTAKVVLILGCFSAERKPVLDMLRETLGSRYNLVPVVFDFEKPASRDLTETIQTIAALSRLIIADISEPRSVPQELAGIVPSLPSVCVQPILQLGATEYAMFEHLARYPWVRPIRSYASLDDLLQMIPELIAV